MKIFFYLILVTQLLFGEVYYAKVEPYSFKKLSSNVTGEVQFIDENSLGKKLSKKPFIIIDSTIDEAELRDVHQKLLNSQETLAIDKKIVANLEAVLKKKRINYKKTEALKIKSRIDKDRDFYDLIASQNSYNATQKEMKNLQNAIADLKLRAIQLKKSIADKHVSAPGYVLYSLNVKEGQVVNISTPLAQVADMSKALLTLYVDADELSGIAQKTIYINGEKTNYKVSRLLRIADSVNISKYKVQIIIKAPKLFSTLAKVEFKENKHEQ